MEEILREARSLGDSAMFDALMPGMSAEDMQYMKAHGPEFWAMLDKMAATDPEAYKEYIRGQIEADLATRTGRRIIMPTPAFCLRGVVATIAPAGAPTPAAAAAAAAGVQLPPRPPLPADLKPAQPLFINVCSHDAVAAPTGPTGASVLEGRQQQPGALPPRDLPLEQLLHLQIPVIVGVVRPIRGTARTEWAVDALVHPWVPRVVGRQPAFEAEFCAFVARCVAEELGVALGGGGLATRVDKLEYAGGNPKVGGGTGGPGGGGSARAETEPVGFDVTAHLAAAAAGKGSGAAAGAPAAAAPAAAKAPPLPPAPAPAPSPAILELGPGRGGAAAAAAAGLFPVPRGATVAGGGGAGGLADGVLRMPGQQQQQASRGGAAAGAPAGAAGSAAAGAASRGGGGGGGVATSAPADVLREVRGRKGGGGGPGIAPAASERLPTSDGAATPAPAPAPSPAAAPPPPPATQSQGIRLSPAAVVSAVAASDGSGRVTATIAFDADVVDAAALRMHLVDLDVEPDALVLVVHTAALRPSEQLAGASVDPVVRVRLPCAVDPESASASYSRAQRTLTVTATAASAAGSR